MSLGSSPLGTAPLGSFFGGVNGVVVTGQAQLNLSAVGASSHGVAGPGVADLLLQATAVVMVRVDVSVDASMPLTGASSGVRGQTGRARTALTLRGVAEVFHAPAALCHAPLPFAALGVVYCPAHGRAAAPIEVQSHALGATGPSATAGATFQLRGYAAVLTGRWALGAGTIRIAASAQCRHGIKWQAASALPLACRATATTAGVSAGNGLANIMITGAGYGNYPVPAWIQPVYVKPVQPNISVWTE